MSRGAATRLSAVDRYFTRRYLACDANVETSSSAQDELIAGR
jgi:hypothetical protein